MKLLVVGSSNFGAGNRGKYAKDIKRLEKTHSNLIKVVGYLPNDILYKYYKISDVAVIPSICEDACPVTMIEYIISGIPQIATISGGIPEISNKGTALLIHKDGRMIDELKNALVFLKENPTILQNLHDACNLRAVAFYKENYYENFSKVVDKIISKI